jgi:proteasome alpha subunit
VNYGMSPALKAGFEQVYGAPYIVKMLMAELGDDAEHDLIVKLDYDGSMARSEIEMKEPFDVLAGSADAEKQMLDYLVDNNSDKSRRSLESALQLAAQTWAVGMETAERAAAEGEDAKSEEIDTVRALKDHLKSRHVEAAVLDRNRPVSSRFRLLDDKEIRAALKDL